MIYLLVNVVGPLALGMLVGYLALGRQWYPLILALIATIATCMMLG